jgi:hypothetical protein
MIIVSFFLSDLSIGFRFGRAEAAFIANAIKVQWRVGAGFSDRLSHRIALRTRRDSRAVGTPHVHWIGADIKLRRLICGHPVNTFVLAGVIGPRRGDQAFARRNR